MPCPPEHLTRDRHLHDVAQLDLFDTRDPHRFSQCPSLASCVVTATGSDFKAILRRMFADVQAKLRLHQCPSPACPQLAFPIRHCLCCPLPLAVNDADFMSSLVESDFLSVLVLLILFRALRLWPCHFFSSSSALLSLPLRLAPR